MEDRKEKPYLLNVLFMITAHVIGLLGFLGAAFGYWKWQTILLGLVMFIVSGLGITIGYHRFFTHCSFECGKKMQMMLAICGATAIQNSIKSWVTDHVKHHQKTDTAGDPYNASRGFWWSHWGWIALKDPDREKENYKAADHLMKDPWTVWLVNFQHKHYLKIAILFSGVLPVLIAWLCWGDLLGGLMFAGFSRLIAVWNMTFLINSLAHMKHWGSSQPYTLANSSRDSWIVSLATFGEGYHNYHHAFPRDYRNGPYWYNFDPSKWAIYLLAGAKITWNLSKTPREQIEIARASVLSKSIAV